LHVQLGLVVAVKEGLAAISSRSRDRRGRPARQFHILCRREKFDNASPTGATPGVVLRRAPDGAVE